MNEIMTQNTDFKKVIAESFGTAAAYYDDYAEVQKEVAGRLIASLEPWKSILPPGPILEIGCGTGFVTKGLLELYSGRELQITDLSAEMVERCKRKYGAYSNATFNIMDGEQHPPVEDPIYAMTISGFTSQWFKDPALTLGRWLEVTQPGGLLLASFPGSESFPEWKKMCRELGLPYTGNTLPDTEEMVIKLSTGPAQVDYYEDTVTQNFSDASDFFRHLKQIGAGTSQKGRSLDSSEMKLLIDHWNSQTGGDITVSYHVVFLAVKRDYDS